MAGIYGYNRTISKGSKRFRKGNNSYNIDNMSPDDFLTLVPKGTKDDYEKLTGKRVKSKDMPKEWIEKKIKPIKVVDQEEASK